MAIFIALVVAGLIIYWFWYTRDKSSLNDANNAPYKIEKSDNIPTVVEVVKEEVKPVVVESAPIVVPTQPVTEPKVKKTAKKAATTAKPKAPRKPKMTVVK